MPQPAKELPESTDFFIFLFLNAARAERGLFLEESVTAPQLSLLKQDEIS